MFSKSRFLKILVSIILLLLIIYLAEQIQFFVKPLQTAISVVLIPLLFGGFLYYLLRPIVYWLTRLIKSKLAAILLTFILVITLISLVMYFGGSVIQTEVNNLIKIFSNYYDIIMQNKGSELLNEKILPLLNEYNFKDKIRDFTNNAVNLIRNNVFGLFSTITNIGTIMLLTILVLFYFLKDDHQLYHKLLTFLPEANRDRADKIIHNIDQTLTRYIGGQLIVALILGTLTYTGYLIIGLPNALILSLFATLLNFIPFIGPIIGIIPAIFIALSSDLLLVIKILVVMVIVQQLEGNVLQPKIQGDRLQIHPLVIIFAVIIFVSLFGFLGALFAVPVYSIFRVLAKEFGLRERLFSSL